MRKPIGESHDVKDFNDAHPCKFCKAIEEEIFGKKITGSTKSCAVAEVVLDRFLLFSASAAAQNRDNHFTLSPHKTVADYYASCYASEGSA